MRTRNIAAEIEAAKAKLAKLREEQIRQVLDFVKRAGVEGDPHALMGAMLKVAALLLLAACTPTTGRETPELARTGSISRGTGAIVPLSLCYRGMQVAAAAGVSPEIARIGYVCSAARGL